MRQEKSRLAKKSITCTDIQIPSILTPTPHTGKEPGARRLPCLHLKVFLWETLGFQVLTEFMRGGQAGLRTIAFFILLLENAGP